MDKYKQQESSIQRLKRILDRRAEFRPKEQAHEELSLAVRLGTRTNKLYTGAVWASNQASTYLSPVHRSAASVFSSANPAFSKAWRPLGLVARTYA
jgi:hypothetical protein